MGMLLIDENKVTDNSLMYIGFDLSISTDDCMRFKVDPDTGAQWQVLDQVKYAEKVREIIRADYEEGEEED
jgi:hypothetical protein